MKLSPRARHLRYIRPVAVAEPVPCAPLPAVLTATLERPEKLFGSADGSNSFNSGRFDPDAAGTWYKGMATPDIHEFD